MSDITDDQPKPAVTESEPPHQVVTVLGLVFTLVFSP